MARTQRRNSQNGLTPFTRAFAAEYLIDLNATQAWKRVKPTCRSDKTAATEGYKLLRRPEVMTELQRLREAQIARADINATRVLEELRRIGLVDPIGFFHADGSMRALAEMTPEVRTAIASIEHAAVNLDPTDGKTTYGRKLKMWDKLKALELLARHLGILKDIVQVEGDWDKLAARLASARQRGV
jgi:phage terminase small subunit